MQLSATQSCHAGSEAVGGNGVLWRWSLSGLAAASRLLGGNGGRDK